MVWAGPVVLGTVVEGRNPIFWPARLAAGLELELEFELEWGPEDWCAWFG